LVELTQKLEHVLSTKGLKPHSYYAWLHEYGETSLVEQVLMAQGMPLIKHDGRFIFKTAITKIEEEIFCIVDIETNGSKLGVNQIIEIGAIKFQNGKIIDTFSSLVHTDKMNKTITGVTGITLEMLKDAPQLKPIMFKFKEFLGQTLFVAHDVKFDYGFISHTLDSLGLEPIRNRKLCTIDLAERTIASKRYGLGHLNDTLKLNPEASHHRALDDAQTTTNLLKILLNKKDKNIKTTEALIRFSKQAPRIPKVL